MLKYITHHFSHREHKKCHRTNRRNSSNDDGAGGHTYRTAKPDSFIRVGFGCFVFYGKRLFHCRSPPLSNQPQNILK